MKIIFGIFIVGILCLSQAGLAVAAPPAQTLVGAYKDWKVYSFMDHDQKICFMASQPREQEGSFKKRGEVFFFVTRWPGEKGMNVVSVSNGYAFKDKSSATVAIDAKKFDLFTQGEMAWTKDLIMDDAIVAEMKKGKALSVHGTSSRGTETTDTYSLQGSLAAYGAMKKTCQTKKGN